MYLNTYCPALLDCMTRYIIIFMPPPGVTGEVYCFPRRKLIFRFGRRVIYHSKGL